jgi:hypothetical protein
LLNLKGCRRGQRLCGPILNRPRLLEGNLTAQIKLNSRHVAIVLHCCLIDLAIQHSTRVVDEHRRLTHGITRVAMTGGTHSSNIPDFQAGPDW